MKRGARGSLALCAFLAAACKKAPIVDDAAPPSAAATPADPSSPATIAAPEETASPRQLPLPEDPRENIDIPTGAVAGGANPSAPAPPTAPPIDPYDAAVASVRASAVGCFAGQPKGEYTATISVVVTPAGRASRVEASLPAGSVADAAVSKCLEQAATRIYPSTTDGRKLSIDVHVKG